MPLRMRITPVSPSIRQFVVVLNVVVVRAIHMYVYPLKSLRLPMVTYHFPHPIPDSIHLYTTLIPLIDIGIDLCSLCNCYPNPWYPLFVSFFFFFFFLRWFQFRFLIWMDWLVSRVRIGVRIGGFKFWLSLAYKMWNFCLYFGLV